MNYLPLKKNRHSWLSAGNIVDAVNIWADIQLFGANWVCCRWEAQSTNHLQLYLFYLPFPDIFKPSLLLRMSAAFYLFLIQPAQLPSGVTLPCTVTYPMPADAVTAEETQELKKRGWQRRDSSSMQPNISEVKQKHWHGLKTHKVFFWRRSRYTYRL